MKIIRYNFLSCRINHGTEEAPEWEEIILSKEIRCATENLQANESAAKKEAYHGKYTVEDDSQPDSSEPTQLDLVEAQATYTAMMTDTLLEV